jgi:chorismate-pyruvate lyase
MEEKEDLEGSMYPPGFSRSMPPPGRSFDISGLPPLLRTILVADGTVTKLIEAYFWEPVDVRVLSQEIVRAHPFDRDTPPEDIIRREVLLMSEAKGRPFAFASSVIVLGQLDERMRDGLLNEAMGIGALLRDNHLETYREQVSVFSRPAGESASALQVTADALVVERMYRIHRNRTPFIQVIEVFPVDMYFV